VAAADGEWVLYRVESETCVWSNYTSDSGLCIKYFVYIYIYIYIYIYKILYIY